jgi:hypothetical protein
MFEVEAFRPVSRRRRLLIALLAIVTAAFVAWAMTRRWGIVRAAHPNGADVAVCSKGQTEACVGSMTAVITAPAPAPASAALR